MLLAVKQKSESDADILLSFDQSNCKVGSKSVLAAWAPTCRRGPVTCERGRNASLKCVSPACSHTNRVPTPWRSLSSGHGIQHPGSGCANTGVTIAVDRIAAKLRSVKVV